MAQNTEEYLSRCRIFIQQLQEQKHLEQAAEIFCGLQKMDEEPLPTLLYIKIIFQLNDLQYFLVMYAFVFEFDMNLITYVQQKMGIESLTLCIIVSLYSQFQSLSMDMINTCIDLLHNPLIFEKTVVSYTMLTKIKLRESFVYYVNSNTLLMRYGLTIWLSHTHDYATLYEHQKRALYQALTTSSSCVLMGEKAVGKKTLLKQCCFALHKPLYITSMLTWKRLNQQEQEQLLYDIILYYHLQNGILYIEDVQSDDDIAYIQYVVKSYSMKLVIGTKDVSMIADELITLPPFLSYEDMHIMSCHLWSMDWKHTAIRLNPWEMQHLRWDEYGEVILPQSSQKSSPFYRCITSAYTLQDWLGDGKIKHQLNDILFFIQHLEDIQRYIHHERYTCTIVFHGPSGTGKTLAAKILGKEAHLPIWQIDLSMVMDKYIGESEKHLREIFQNAEKHNVILLFDEADVLFSKRTSVQSANDRYANSSTTYLLQELERYQGIIILTSNLLSNFDDAFLRRVRYIIRFPLPDDKVKAEKWKNSFAQLPMNVEPDYILFAQKLNLTLAQIENVHQNAICYWLQEGCDKMELIHIYKAIQLEYQKRMDTLPAFITNELYAVE